MKTFLTSQMNRLRPESETDSSVQPSTNSTGMAKTVTSPTFEGLERTVDLDSPDEFAEWLSAVQAPSQSPTKRPNKTSEPKLSTEVFPDSAETSATTTKGELNSGRTTPFSTKGPSKDGSFDQTILLTDGPVDTTASVNQPRKRVKVAHAHLATLGLNNNASWSKITARYQQISKVMNATTTATPAQRSALDHTRRKVNTAYACLRLLSAEGGKFSERHDSKQHASQDDAGPNHNNGHTPAVEARLDA